LIRYKSNKIQIHKIKLNKQIIINLQYQINKYQKNKINLAKKNQN